MNRVHRTPRSRRAAALLIVLATLVVVSAGLSLLAGAAATAAAARRSTHACSACEDLLRAADAPILAWLERQAPHAVLPPEAALPEILVLHDRVAPRPIPEGPTPLARELVITAYDQLGMLPLSAIESPLASALPPDAVAAVRSAPAPSGSPPGLDLLTHDAPPGNPRVFPRGDRASTVRAFPDSADAAPTPVQPARPNEPIPLGALLATHPHPARPAPRINVNTAPLPLVAEALRLAGRGGLEQISESRAAGRPFTPGDSGDPAAPSPSTDRASARRPVPVGVSDCWAFRIDASCGGVTQSRWVVYAREGEGWAAVQRLVIDE